MKQNNRLSIDSNQKLLTNVPASDTPGPQNTNKKVKAKKANAQTKAQMSRLRNQPIKNLRRASVKLKDDKFNQKIMDDQHPFNRQNNDQVASNNMIEAMMKT